MNSTQFVGLDKHNNSIVAGAVDREGSKLAARLTLAKPLQPTPLSLSTGSSAARWGAKALRVGLPRNRIGGLKRTDRRIEPYIPHLQNEECLNFPRSFADGE